MYDKLENWKWYFKETDVKEKMLIKKKVIVLDKYGSDMGLNSDNLTK